MERIIHKLSLGSGILRGYKIKNKWNIKWLSLKLEKYYKLFKETLRVCKPGEIVRCWFIQEKWNKEFNLKKSTSLEKEKCFLFNIALNFKII